jgi:hypothetical protein
MVPQVGLEPTRLSALASKTSVATITPPGQIKQNNFLKNNQRFLTVNTCIVYQFVFIYNFFGHRSCRKQIIFFKQIIPVT